jgi:hypothetical protein
MIIRDLRPEDKTQWAPLWAGYLEFYESTLDPAVTDTTFGRLNDSTEPMFALVAQDEGGALTGFVHCVLHRGTWTIGDFCYLEDLFVAPQARAGAASGAL